MSLDEIINRSQSNGTTNEDLSTVLALIKSELQSLHHTGNKFVFSLPLPAYVSCAGSLSVKFKLGGSVESFKA